MISTLIVDDEKQNRDSLRGLLEQYCSKVKIIGEASSISEARKIIEADKPKLLFLDVEMPNGSGFDLLKQLDNINFKVIFVTAHAHYAIKAIRISAVDYLLKPVDVDELISAVNKAENELSFNHENHNRVLLDNLKSVNKPKLAVPVKDGVAFLSPEDIIRLEADGAYTHIYSTAGKYMATKNIREYELILSDHNFFRSHNSHLINLKHVMHYSRIDGYFVQMSDGSNAEISRRKKHEFLQLMNK